jgi:6-pyruvoyltetrahydropterin/6-carboxytetrahydropterin synthase
MGAGHPYARLHGHSFQVDVTIAGGQDADHGWVVDFDDVDKALAALRDTLCHNYLNDIEGLENPSLENIALWIVGRLKDAFPGLARVTVRRPSCGEACTYTLPA